MVERIAPGDQTSIDLLHDSGLARRERDELREIMDAAKRSVQLTRRLLAFSRHGVGKIEVFDLNGTVRTMVSMLERLLGEAIDVSLDLTPYALPVRADRGQLVSRLRLDAYPGARWSSARAPAPPATSA